VLVDFRSNDGLSAWVWENFEPDIAVGRLQFFEVLDDVNWHIAKAKNVAHRLARGSFLFNLDGDNYLLPEDLRLIRSAAARGLGCRQGTGDLRDGTPGRIGIHRKAFHEIGGFDEGLLGMVVEDYDLIVRAEAAGHRFLRLGPPGRMPIQNGTEERLREYIHQRTPDYDDLKKIAQVNFTLSKLRLEWEGPVRRQNFSSYRGKLNGAVVILDGLGNITPAA